MPDEKKTPERKNFTTKTIISAFAVKVEEVIGENILDDASPARKESVGDILDWLIQHDYGMEVNYVPSETEGPGLFDTSEQAS